MDETVRGLGNREFHVTAVVARWYAATGTFTWVNCGHPPPLLVTAGGELEELAGPAPQPLGAPDVPEPTFVPTSRVLARGDRLVLVTDGVTERRMEGGGRFGVEGIRAAVAEAADGSAAATAMTILQRVTDCWREPLEDDGTAVVLAVG